MSSPPHLQVEAQRLLTLLANKAYDELERRCGGERLSASDLRSVIAQYGRTLVPPPSDFGELMDITRVAGDGAPCWMVAVPVWTQEEGRSDLTLEFSLTLEGERTLLTIDDLHVL